MNKEDFEKLPKETQDIVFNDMCELFDLTCKYPITVKELKIFTEWHSKVALFGEDLKRFLEKKQDICLGYSYNIPDRI